LRESIETWLIRFTLEPVLHLHAVEVFVCLPHEVRSDLMDDPTFTLTQVTHEDDGSMSVWVPSPANKTRIRCVVLKRSLAARPVSFARYIIAHELAHAYLSNEGRWPGEDPEAAADALAAEWGFPRPY
jgi:hypothetical protein